MNKQIKIALAGNPNSGKTTLFNALTGSNQFVGNWPGVTVEKKEGRLRKHEDVVIMDLPGIYSLSPYTLEEVVARNYLIDQRPDAILNIIDGTNLERNLYLTTQLTELGIPVVVAINMMDVVRKNGDKIDTAQLSEKLGCRIVEISALKGDGVMEAAEAAIKAAHGAKTVPMHTFSGPVEHAIAHIEEAAVHNMPLEQQRWYAIKIFERDDKVLEKLDISKDVLDHIDSDIKAAEKELDDDAESIITNERYVYIAEIIKCCYKKKNQGRLSASDKIDRVVTNRWLGLPIFAAVMFLVYYLAMVTVGASATDWANDGLFGDGWHLFGIGSAAYNEVAEEYGEAAAIVDGYEAYVEENGEPADGKFTYEIEDEETLAVSEETATLEDYEAAKATLQEIGEEPDPADYGVWVPGVPVLIESALDKGNCAEWLRGLILDGIVAGVGAVLGFVPQMLVLFLLLAALEDCGYMARIAFILDRLFLRFGLSGKSFIPMLIGLGCGVPAVQASRTIENDRDRKMTIMTTTFIPCSAKLPIIGLIAGALFNESGWVATSAYFVGIAAIIISGIILKKTKLFAGEPAPFVMELPAYHIPSVKGVLIHMWDRAKAFVRKAGTIIFLSSVVIWFLSSFNFQLQMVDTGDSILAAIGRVIAPIFAPLGWGHWEAAVGTISGLVAKENLVAIMGILYGFAEVAENGDEMWSVFAQNFTAISAYSFLVFNLLCAPCFAAIGAIHREMGSAKWTWIAIGYQCIFAYIVSLIIYQLGTWFATGVFGLGTIVAIILVAALVYLLVRPNPEDRAKKLKSAKAAA